MAEIINLRQARKNKARTQKSEKAAENRTKFGRNKLEKQKALQSIRRAKKDLDGKKIEE